MTNNISDKDKLLINSSIDDKFVKNWLNKLEAAQKGHYTETEFLNKVNLCFGVALIILTTGVTAFIFFDPATYKELTKLCLAIASAIAAALSGMVTFGRFGERASEHRITAGRYGKLRRQLEFLQATSSKTIKEDEFKNKLKLLRIEWEYVAANAPLTPKKGETSYFRPLLIRFGMIAGTLSVALLLKSYL
ncbi:SLATT domain-containing protein [Moritella marina ATCC 15381]|uniref:SLATT domain-containing protein n=1 Tax=Moritella marina ATCC 15381 TaxID=1202962 RepID=A0A5J6WIZ1_MORMI|nr:SLATT domain-containing protein [Moritella marina]QFI38149.1 SLATT domain-containing protein [Moritella marina ATCC 15381]